MKKKILIYIRVLIFLFYVALVVFFPQGALAASNPCGTGFYQKLSVTEKCITPGESNDWCTQHGLGSLSMGIDDYCCCEFGKCSTDPSNTDPNARCASSQDVEQLAQQCRSSGGTPLLNQPLTANEGACSDGVKSFMPATMDIGGKFMVKNFCCNKTTTPLSESTASTSPSGINGPLLLQIPIGGKTSITPCLNVNNNVLSCGGIGDYILLAYTWIIGVVGILSMVTFAYAGLLWLLSRGDSGKIKQAQKVLTDTVAGLVLALGSYLILFIINPNLVDLNPLLIRKIKPLEDEVHFQKKLSNIKVNSDTITISIWDFGNIDNDKVRITFNDKVLIETLTLKGPPGSTYILHLKPGVNKFEVYAHNEGDPDKYSPTNTAKIKFTNVDVGLTEQGWGLKTGEHTSMIITAPGGTAPREEEAPIREPI